MFVILSLIAGLLLAYANGANDNFKGVATLYGSGTTTYRRALTWATVTTAAGSLCAVWLARELLARFSGKGIVTEELASQGEFGVAVALGAGITVLLASRLGLPISTTHALVGGMVGAAAASYSQVNWQLLSTHIVAPLMLSPILAVVGTAIIYLLLRSARVAMGIERETCLCAGREVVATVPVCCNASALSQAQELSLSMGTTVTCRERYSGKMIGIEMGQPLDSLHFLSAGMVGFARGLNDTPKIAALLLLVPVLSSASAVVLCGIAIAVGGVFSGRRIAETLSHRITPMNPGQGLSANLVTSLLVIGASRWGLPVSTTHVTCGALFGIAAVNGGAHWRAVSQIVLAWITTVPLAAILSALCFHLASV